LEDGMIREAVKEAMKLRKVKSKDLAEYIGVTKSNMSLFLNGKLDFKQDKVEKILDFLDIKLVITQ
jgi:DNA-binding Xre family transcriptional regulator